MPVIKNVLVFSDLHNTSVIIGTVSCWHICRLVGIDVQITIADNNSAIDKVPSRILAGGIT